MTHDYLNDSANYSRIVKYNGPNGSSWAAAGAPSITRGPNGTWYTVVRQRYANGSRGKVYEIYRADNLSASWTPVFSEPMDDDTRSVEGSSLRHYNDTWHLYFTYEVAHGEWRTVIVTAQNISGLQSRLDAPDSWRVLGDTLRKDPSVFEVNGTYVLMAQPDMLVSNTPTFDSYDVVAHPVRPFIDNSLYRGPTTGTLLHQHGTYVYWFSWWDNDGNVFWGFFAADTVRGLGNASYLGSIKVGTNDGKSGDSRYMSYYTVDSKQVFVLEWDHDNDGVRDTFLWNYTDA